MEYPTSTPQFIQVAPGCAIHLPILSHFLMDGDIINIDITLYLNGYHGDTSQTFEVGHVVS